MEMEYRSSSERARRVQRNVRDGTLSDAAALGRPGGSWSAGPLRLTGASLWTFGRAAPGTATVYHWSRRRVGAEWALRSYGLAVVSEVPAVPAVARAGAAVLPGQRWSAPIAGSARPAGCCPPLRLHRPLVVTRL